jgi:hypothetical protein
MREAIAAAVQVVTVSDWPAIVTGIAIGVVGLAGIMATYWQGKRAAEAASESLRRSIDAGNERARLAEKRRIYAACQAAFTAMRIESITHRVAYQPPAKQGQRDAAELALNQARRAMLNATGELLLIAPTGVRRIAADLTDNYLSYITATVRGASLEEPTEPAGRLQNQLYEAMRADLGESAEPAGPPDSWPADSAGFLLHKIT